MKRLLIALLLAMAATAAYAACTTTTYITPTGTVVCVECCANGHCTVTCS